MNPKDYNNLDVELTGVKSSTATHIEHLVDEKTHIRQSARETLVNKGEDVLPAVHKLLRSNNSLLRWEAAKILESIGSPESIPALISLLEDKNGEVRWIAAVGLINVGRDSIKPLLKELTNTEKDTYYIRSGAHHVFKELFTQEEKDRFKDFLEGLDNKNRLSETVPVEARRILDENWF